MPREDGNSSNSGHELHQSPSDVDDREPLHIQFGHYDTIFPNVHLMESFII